MDGRINARLLRVNTTNKNKDGSVRAYITAVVTRGKRYDEDTDSYIDNQADFPTFEKYIPAENEKQLNYLKDLAEKRALVEITYSIKTSSYTNADGENRTKQFLRLDRFDVLESKAQMETRLGDKSDAEQAGEEFAEAVANIFG